MATPSPFSATLLKKKVFATGPQSPFPINKLATVLKNHFLGRKRRVVSWSWQWSELTVDHADYESSFDGRSGSQAYSASESNPEGKYMSFLHLTSVSRWHAKRCHFPLFSHELCPLTNFTFTPRLQRSMAGTKMDTNKNMFVEEWNGMLII